jgi:hypothetical protein
LSWWKERKKERKEIAKDFFSHRKSIVTFIMFMWRISCILDAGSKLCRGVGGIFVILIEHLTRSFFLNQRTVKFPNVCFLFPHTKY